jgi:UDP-glucose 4-epimerase
MEKAVVTGGAGFIGSHLAEELVSEGYHVIIFDDLSTGKVENIETLLKNKSAEFIQGGITDYPRLQKVFDGAAYVFHHAACKSIAGSIADPLSVNETNIEGTLKVLMAARDCGVRKVIFASSSSVYGNTATIPQNEDMPPSPLSPYAVTKLTGEHYGTIFRQIYGLSTVCLRYFNVYGPRQDVYSPYAAVIPTFIQKVSQNLPPVIFGDGEQSRDFVFVRDVVRANILAARNNAEGVYNVGSGYSVTINQLVATILQLMGKDLKPVHEDTKPGEVSQSLADIKKASGFGYKPRWSLKDGMAETVAYFEKTGNKK